MTLGPLFQQTYWRCYTILRRLNHVLPTTCLLCHDRLIYGQSVCTNCLTYFTSPEVKCSQCAVPLIQQENTICTQCHIRLPAFDHTVAATVYKPPADNMVIKLKYHQQLMIAHAIADIMQHTIVNQPCSFTLPDLLCVVPLSRQRLAERGFNQALEIAKPLSLKLGIPLHGRLCKRHRHTHSQAQLSGALRQTNLQHAFSIPERYLPLIDQRHIGVIDDVMTTGETLDEIAMTLKSCGAAQVTNFVFARTVLHQKKTELR